MNSFLKLLFELRPQQAAKNSNRAYQRFLIIHQFFIIHYFLDYENF